MQELSNLIFVLPKKEEEKVSKWVGEEVNTIYLDYLPRPSVISLQGALSVSIISKIPKIIRDLFNTTVEVDVSVSTSKDEVKETQTGRPLPKPFFRYARGKDATGAISSLGGAAFLINLLPNTRQVNFSVALCHSKDNFDSAMSRSICNHRLAGGQYFVLENYNPDISILDNIALAVAAELGYHEEMIGSRADKQVFSQIPKYISKSEHAQREFFLNLYERLSNK